VPSQSDESSGINWQAVSAVAAVVVAVAAVVTLVTLKPFGGGGETHVPTGPPKPTESTPSTTETETTPTETTTTTAGPTHVCQAEITLEGYASYSLDECTANREGTVGIFEVRERIFEVVSVAKLDEWVGHNPPSISDCISGTSASGAESVKLKRIGQWLCAEGSDHHVMRIRFDSFTPPANISEGGVYKFFVDVYESESGEG
jgi:hypothetical protein